MLIVLLSLAAAGVVFVIHQNTTPSSIVWTGCSGGFQCGSVQVPLDYSNPAGETINIAIIRKPATLGWKAFPFDSTQRIGALMINPGGPGGSGIAYLRRAASSLKNLNVRFDLVSFDPRGVGQSAPVRCLTDSQRDSLNAIDAVLDDPQEKQAFIQADYGFAQACEQRNGKVLRFLDTASTARDMDLIRSALGEAKLTYLGFSYSLLGETYAHLFPTHVRAMALDGIFDPTLNVSDQLLQESAALETNLQAFLANCRAFVGCQLAKSGDPGARLSALMQRLDQDPMAVGTRVLTRRHATAGVLLDLYDPRYWNSLDLALTNADNGDGQLLLTLADIFDGRHGNGSYSNAADASIAINCLDHPVPPNIAAYDALGPALAKASPLFGPELQYSPLVCAYWPATPTRQPQALNADGAPPILLIGATEDTLAPYSGAQAVNRQLAGSVLLTREGYGHTSYDKSVCVREATSAYLTDLRLPVGGTICSSDVP